MKLYKNKINELDISKINDVLRTGDIGFGSNVQIFENSYKSFSKKRYNIATNSASAASFMIFSYLRDQYGTCDVYTTSLGFTSPAWSAKHFGHNLFFVDVQDDLQFSTEEYKKNRKQTNNKVVVMPVLYRGISTIKNFELFGDEIVVVDSAHCSTPSINSDFVFFSFHTYKPICTSDGGMISTDNKQAEEYFKKYRNFGRVVENGGYNIRQDGFKFYMNNLNATIGLTQIKRYKDNLDIRKKNYYSLLEKYNLLPHDEKSSFYFATCLVDNANEILKKFNLIRNYPMLHKMEYYNTGQKLKNLEKLHGKILNLPLWGADV